MGARETLLRQFEEATAECAHLGRQLSEAEATRDRLRRQLRALLRDGGATETAENGHDAAPSSEAVMDAVVAVRDAGEPVDAQRLSGMLGVSPSVARTRLQRGVQAKLLRRLSRGKYEAVPTE